MTSIAKKFYTTDFLKFMIIGGSSAISAVALLYLAVDILHQNYLFSFIIIFVAVNVYAYVASRRFAFRSTSVRIHSGLARYLSVSTLSLVFNSIALVALVELLDLNPVFANALLAIFNAPLNFLLHRKFTFAIRTSKPE